MNFMNHDQTKPLPNASTINLHEIQNLGDKYFNSQLRRVFAVFARMILAHLTCWKFWKVVFWARSIECNII